MRIFIPVLAVALLVVCCFLPWITVESKNIVLTGMETAGTRYGKPAIFHFLWGGLYLAFMVIPKMWGRRVAMVFAALNIAWALRNFLLLPTCSGGICPQRQLGLYGIFFLSLLLFVLSFSGVKKQVTPITEVTP